MEAIEVSHLTFSYDGKNDILKDVSFSIPKGSYTTIIGHNGSGKSTMAKTKSLVYWKRKRVKFKF